MWTVQGSLRTGLIKRCIMRIAVERNRQACHQLAFTLLQTLWTIHRFLGRRCKVVVAFWSLQVLLVGMATWR